MKKTQKITSFLLSLILIFVPVTIKGQEETSPQKVYEDGNKVVYRTVKEVEGKINHWEVVYDYKIKPTKNIYILIDRSKEMQRGDYFNKTKTGAKNLAKKMLEDNESFSQITVITYNYQEKDGKPAAQVEIGPSRDLVKIKSSIDRISLDGSDKTNHQAGYHEARKLINKYKADKNYIVNLTNKVSRQSYDFETYLSYSKYDKYLNSRTDLEEKDMNYGKYAEGGKLLLQYYKAIIGLRKFLFKNHALSELNMIKKDGRTRFYSVGIEPTDTIIFEDEFLGGEKDFFKALASSEEDYYESEKGSSPSIEESMDKIGDSIKADSIKATDLLTRSISDKFIKEVELEGGGNEINLNLIDNLEESQDKEGFYNGTRSYKISLRSTLTKHLNTKDGLDRMFKISESLILYYGDEKHELDKIDISPLQYDVFARFYTYDENGKMYFITSKDPIKIVKNKNTRDIRVANIIDNTETDRDISHQPNFVDDYDEGQVTYETSPVNDLFSDQLLLYRRELNHDVYNKEVGQTGTDKLVFNLENSEISSTGSDNKEDFRDYFVVLNRLVRPIELRVKTIWLDRNGNLIENRQDKNIINLFKNRNKLDRDLATENDDYLIIGDLPYYDEKGANIKYSVTSPYQEGFIQVDNDLEKYEPSEIATNDYKDSYDLNVVMREAKFDLPIEARWRNEDNKDLTDKIDEEIRVNIYRTVANKRSLFQSLDLNKANGYKATLKDLDRYDSQENPYIYEVLQENATKDTKYENNIIKFGSLDFSPVKTVIIYNLLPKTSIDVEKIWEVNDQALIKPIEIKLFRKGLEESAGNLNLNSENNWKGTFDNLDKYDKEGELIEYAIQEVAIEGTYATITKTSEKGYTIVNKEKILPMTGGAGNKFLYTTGILSLISLFLVLEIKRRTRMGDIDD